jgi:hypothetical protein
MSTRLSDIPVWINYLQGLCKDRFLVLAIPVAEGIGPKDITSALFNKRAKYEAYMLTVVLVGLLPHNRHFCCIYATGACHLARELFAGLLSDWLILLCDTPSGNSSQAQFFN